METALEMVNICKSFPGVHALRNVSLSVKKGEVHGLVGENGAGKSTLMKVLSGAYLSESGSLRINGLEVRHITPHKMLELGVAVIYQELMLADHLTVAENIYLGRMPLTPFGMVDYAAMEKGTREACGYLGLELDPRTQVKTLSIAKRQMVEIAKALSRDAKIIVLDEPTAVLGENELRGMFDVVKKLAKRGVSFVYISHRLKEVFELADRVTIMKDGEVVETGRVEEYTVDRLIRGMVGRELMDIYPAGKRTPGNVALSVRNLSRRGILEDVSFDLHEGEILAIAGLAGSGRTEVLKAIIGDDPIDSGTLVVGDTEMKVKSPGGAIAKGLGIIPEDRKGEGLFLKQPVRFNSTIAKLSKFLNGGLLNLNTEKQCVSAFIDKINIRPGNPDAIVKNLSGGNQQKVVFAKWLNAECKILLVDEPTRGIDVGAKHEIYTLLDELVRSGMAVLMVSSELPEVLGLSDRVLVMHQGRIAKACMTSETTEEELMMYATGQEDDCLENAG